MPRVTVVISQGQSANPLKRKLEEDLVAALLGERHVEVTVVPHLYDLTADHTGMLCLQGISGDMIVVSWLFGRAAHWTLDRNGIRGQFGSVLLDYEADDQREDDEQAAHDEAAAKERVHDSRPLPNRKIYCLDLRVRDSAQPFVDEIRRIVREANTSTISLLGWIGGQPQPASLDRFMNPSRDVAPATKPEPTAEPATSAEPAAIAPTRITDDAPRRWYPVIDYSRCTNCMECIDFCLFGVYGVDKIDTILVEQPDNCRKGCPACSRVCPENAIIFPQHKSPSIAGSPHEDAGGGLKIDLSKLFGAPDAMELAARERDVELVAVGRDAVGLTVGIPKRQLEKPKGPKDDLDHLIDALDEIDL